MNYLELLYKGEYDRLVREALPLAETNPDAARALLRLCQGRNNFFLMAPATVEQLQSQAKAGNRYAQYAFARYHVFVRNSEESIKLSYDNMLAAAEQNLPDAVAGLASSIDYGDMGWVDRERAADLMDKAFRAGSELAAIYRLKEYCFGKHFLPAQTDKAEELANDLILHDEKAGHDVNGYWYFYRACAREGRFGRSSITVSEDYRRALKLGILDAYADLIMAAGYGDEGAVLRMTNEYNRLIEEGMQRNYAGAYYLDAVAELQGYDALEDTSNDLGHERENRTPELMKASYEKILARFTRAAELGDNASFEMLGDLYQEGGYGFEQNDEMAFACYSRGVVRDHLGCVEKAWKMMHDHLIDRPLDYMDSLAILGARWDSKRLLAETVIAHQQGRLQDCDEEITKYYDPIFDAPEFSLDDDEDYLDDDDFEEDDGRYDAWA